MKRIILIFILSVSVSMSLHGVVVGNDLEEAYSNGNNNMRSSVDNQVKNIIITGAGYFLESNAGFQHFLSRIEMSQLNGVNYIELGKILEDLITNLENANSYYYQLKNIVAGLPYNYSVIASLKSFDYLRFMYNNGINNVLFNKVKVFLSSGNVTGVCEELFLKTAELLDILYSVKKSIDNSSFPEISILWKINQLYFDTLLFGQYVAMVFNTLDK